MTINPNEIARQVLDFQKGAFASWYDAMSIFQDQAATAVDTLLNQTGWFPDEGRQVISSWTSACKNERDRYKIYLEESISGLEKFLARETKTVPVSPGDPAAEAKAAAPEIKSKPAAVEKKKTDIAQETKKSIQ